MKRRFFSVLLALVLTLTLLPGTSLAAAPAALPYEIDTVASDLFRFHSLVMDNSNHIYYADGDTVCLAGGASLDLTMDFESELYNPYLSYDPYNNAVYLLANDARTNGIKIYNITDFDAPALVLDQNNCPALLENGCTGSLLMASTPAQQIPVLADGSLLVPCADNNTWIVNIKNKTVTQAVRMHALHDGYAVLVSGQVMQFQDEQANASVSGVEYGSASTRVRLTEKAPYNSANSVCGKYDGAYFYQDSVGVRYFTVDGKAHTLIPQEEISILDGQSLDRTNIWGLAVGDAGCVAFYDYSLAAIRLIRPAERTVTFVDRHTGGVIATRRVRPGTALGALPTAPSHSGYTFQGWYDGDGTAVSASTKVTGDMTVYAQYQEEAAAPDITISIDFENMEISGNNVTVNVFVYLGGTFLFTIPVTLQLG